MILIKNKKLVSALKVSISILFLLIGIDKINSDILKEVFIKINSYQIFALLSLVFLHFFLLALRWHFLLKVINISTTLIENLSVYFKSLFINTFTPSNIGADIYRFTYLKNKSLSNINILSILILERLFGIIGLVSLLYIPLLILSFNGDISISLVNNLLRFSIMLLVIIVVIYIFLSKLLLTYCYKFSEKIVDRFRIFKKIDELILKFDIIFFSLRTNFLIPIFLTLISFLVWTLVLVSISEFLSLNYSFLAILATASLTEIIRFIPLSIQGIGIREFSFATIYTNFFSFSYDDGYILSLYGYVILSILLLASAPIGQILWFSGKNKKHLN